MSIYRHRKRVNYNYLKESVHFLQAETNYNFTKMAALLITNISVNIIFAYVQNPK